MMYKEKYRNRSKEYYEQKSRFKSHTVDPYKRQDTIFNLGAALTRDGNLILQERPEMAGLLAISSEMSWRLSSGDDRDDMPVTNSAQCKAWASLKQSLGFVETLSLVENEPAETFISIRGGFVQMDELRRTPSSNGRTSSDRRNLYN
ncbi:unnamed protein product [Cylindrotheca closterium]|uniref:Uncharacterized protein n=1 Tax=Cylindrotheca closterium TaxID=2856 RepID=A0AAD2FR62_9STRA|nr:unnamed protein product [Cylindrotheca closterium]